MPTLNNPQANQAPAPAKSAELMAAEREALANTLKTRGEGGSVSKTFAGTDVPKLLDESPGTRQLLEEAIRIQTGQNSRQQTAPPKDIEAAGIVDSNASQTNFNNLTSELAAAEQASNESSSAALASSIPTSTAYDDSEAQAMIGQSREQNAAQLEQQIEGIRASFVGRRQEQQYQNRSQTGATRAMMARSGAGGFASGKTAVSNRVAEGQRAMNALAAVEAQAINMAKAAAAGRDTEMLAKSLAAAEQARVSQNEVRQEQFQNYIAERNMALQDKEASYRSQDRAREDLSQLSNLSPEAVAKLEPAQIQQMEMDSGLPEGYFNAFQETQTAMNQAASSEARFEKEKELFNMAMDAPHGYNFAVGDYEVTGLNVEDFKVFKSDDGKGNITFSSFNPASGEVMGSQTITGIGKNVSQPIQIQRTRVRGPGQAPITSDSEEIPKFGVSKSTADLITQHFADQKRAQEDPNFIPLQTNQQFYDTMVNSPEIASSSLHRDDFRNAFLDLDPGQENTAPEMQKVNGVDVWVSYNKVTGAAKITPIVITDDSGELVEDTNEPGYFEDLGYNLGEGGHAFVGALGSIADRFLP